jgi:hypothetical protein
MLVPWLVLCCVAIVGHGAPADGDAIVGDTYTGSREQAYCAALDLPAVPMSRNLCPHSHCICSGRASTSEPKVLEAIKAFDNAGRPRDLDCIDLFAGVANVAKAFKGAREFEVRFQAFVVQA